MNQGMNPYQAPSTQTLSQQVDRDWKWLLFSFDGRASRGEYWRGSLLAGAVVFGICVAIGVSMALVDFAFDTAGASIILGLAALVLAVPLIWVSFAIGVKRWHDRGKSGAWMLITFIPYIGSLWVLVECGFLQGTPGDNAYGPDPLG